jgi:D-3-phosphoglycerate dehydrogenase
MKYKVVITDCEYDNIDSEKSILETIGAEVILCQTRNGDELIKLSHDCDALIFQYAKIDKKIIDNLSKCKIISKYATGLDGIDLEAATERNILVSNVREYCTEEVSTHAVALLLAVSRKITYLDKLVKNGVWDYKYSKPIRALNNSKIGIIGFGKIAKSIIEKLKCFCTDISVMSTYTDDKELEKHNVSKKSFEEILKTSDYIIVATMPSHKNYHLFDIDAFSLMKKDAFIINISRGTLIDENALYDALINRNIAGAALDVLSEEPPTENLMHLLNLENVIVTPHAAWYSDNSQRLLQKTVALDVKRALTGLLPHNLVAYEKKQ